MEHVKIMSEIIGRPLTKEEMVHHIDFIKTNNNPDNLYLYESRSRHMKDTRSIFQLISELLKREIIVFNNGAYLMNDSTAQEAVNVQARSKL